MSLDLRSYPVLYVDDDRANLLAVQYALEDTFRIDIATSGEEALRMLEDQTGAPVAVESVQRMGPESVFPGGVVIRGRSTTFPDAYLDFALPSSEAPERFELDQGTVIRIDEATMCAALLHVDRQEEAKMVFTPSSLIFSLSATSFNFNKVLSSCATT